MISEIVKQSWTSAMSRSFATITADLYASLAASLNGYQVLKLL